MNTDQEMKLSSVKTKTFSEASAAALDAAIATFVQADDQKDMKFMGLEYSVITGPSYTAIIAYTN
jgi:hypothetical protein